MSSLAPRFDVTEDEHDVDFDDTRHFSCLRWESAVEATSKELTAADCKTISEPKDLIEVQKAIQRRWNDPRTAANTKRIIAQLIQFPRTLATFLGTFTTQMLPETVNFTPLWGLVDLSLNLSFATYSKLVRTAGWIKKLRGSLDLFNRCLENCDDYNEARHAMVDVIDSTLQIFVDSVVHLRNFPTDEAASRAWRHVEVKIRNSLEVIDTSISHVHDISKYSFINREQQIRDFQNRYGSQAPKDEKAAFPLMMIKRDRNKNFYGREEELDKIDKYLGTRNLKTLRTYTIYGRRGVGKTDLALEYAYRNKADYDAIFWINCETRLALRLSYTEMAVALELPNATRDGHHEENQLAVNNWLKNTKKRWLLIFDNAEKEKILKGYWPVGGVTGSILVTSRSFFNFTMDAVRKGETIKPFTRTQSKELLFKLLGPTWQELSSQGKIISSEDRAASELLDSVGHLALAIEQVAKLISDPVIGASDTIASTLESFKKRKRDLAPRLQGERTDIVKSLDTLWDMMFTRLTTNARDLLSVLSLLSPDIILLDLLLPKSQKALDGKLAFCKQHPAHVDPDSQAALASIISCPPLLEEALNELERFSLIRRQNRFLWCHRVVAEAMNFHSKQEIQEYFDSASALVYEAFPKQVDGNYLSRMELGECQEYISHGSHLSFMFYKYHSPGGKQVLYGTTKFIKLLCNCAWYLYELSDYDLCLLLARTGKLACGDDRETIAYATLCNVAGCSYSELNRLGETREEFGKYLRLQQALLAEGDLSRATSLHNMGNIETASDNLDEAMQYYKKALDIRIAHGDVAASLIANSYLCIARAHFYKQEWDMATSVLSQSEALYFRTAGADAHFMTHVHYLFGNIEYRQKRWTTARRSYELALKISLQNAPIHPITAAAYYSIGCVEYAKRNAEGAKVWLEKALNIAELRSPGRDDGTIARILWKISQVLESNPVGLYRKEADELRIRAERARRELTGKGEGGVVIALDDDGNEVAEDLQASYDQLVHIFFR